MRLSCWSIALLCLFNHALAQDSVKISGTILNPVSDSVEVAYNSNKLAYYPQRFFAQLDKKGHFSIKFPVPAGIYIQTDIAHGKKVAEMILYPGDSLAITADAKRFDSTLHFEGRGSAIQNFIVQHTIARKLMNQYTIKAKTYLQKEPAEFLKSIEQERKAEMDLLGKYKANLPASFTRYWTAYFQYYNYFFLQQYPQVHEILKKKRYTDTIPSINYSVLSEMPDAFNDSLLQVPSYLLYLTGVIDTRLKSEGYTYLGKSSAEKYKIEDSVNALAYERMTDKSAEYFIAQNIYGRARYEDPLRNKKQFAMFKQRWPKSEYLPLLDKQITMAARFAKGQPAPDFKFTTREGKEMKLSDLRGKVVYLNFWANWCRQCVGEMIGEQKIKALIKNKPLEWLNVSISTDTAKDTKMIAQFKLDGIHTHFDGEWEGREIQLYGVQALPGYFLIDENGNFATQNTPTPTQSTELILEIEKLFR